VVGHTSDRGERERRGVVKGTVSEKGDMAVRHTRDKTKEKTFLKILGVENVGGLLLVHPLDGRDYSGGGEKVGRRGELQGQG